MSIGKEMKVLILGGDGYLGWPTALYLSKRHWDVVVVDSYLRRKIMRDHDVQPLFLYPELPSRIAYWNRHTGYHIKEYIGDLSSSQFVNSIFSVEKPDVIVHFAEQPSAPYSMLNQECAMLTLTNNLVVTSNVLFGIYENCPDAHLIKLGTMGEYGTPNIDIEEGWIDIEHQGRSDRFLFPRQGGSLYHTTKIMDTDLIWFYVRMWSLRVTDLMQGPVYGISTEEISVDETLGTFFSYDELFGTVLNRFMAQAVVGHPLTIYGKGQQSRGFLNLVDTVKCIGIAMEKPADRGELRILNQFTETFSVNELAEKIIDVASKFKCNVRIAHRPNPRVEAEDHYYNPKNTNLLDLGLRPKLLTEDVLAEIFELVWRARSNVDPTKFELGVKWR